MYFFTICMFQECLLACRVLLGLGLIGCSKLVQMFPTILVNKILSFSNRMDYIIFLYQKKQLFEAELEVTILSFSVSYLVY